MSSDIGLVEVYDSDRYLIAQSDLKFEPNYLGALTVEVPVMTGQYSEENEDLEVHDRKEIGTVKISMSRSSLRYKFFQLFLKSLVATIIAICSGLAISVFIVRHLSLSIQELLISAKNVPVGQYHYKPQNFHTGELGELQRAFKAMIKSLRELNNQFELSLQVKTLELTTKTQELARASEERKQVIQRINMLIEEERRQIAVEFHDVMNTVIVSILGHSRQAQQTSAVTDPKSQLEKARIHLTEIESGAKYLYSLSRDFITNLKPEELEEFGLAEALKTLVHHHQSADDHVQYQCIVNEECPRFSREVEFSLYRIVQESLSNVTKHSQATNAFVKLHLNFKSNQCLVKLIISDNGVGIKEADRASTGLIGMRERAEVISAYFEITSSSSGTQVCVSGLFDVAKI